MTGTGARSGERFDTYVAGPQGALAVTAARAVAESRHPPFNPLFLVGAPGFGKSHLLSAIEALAAHLDPARRALRVTAAAFRPEQGQEWTAVDLLLLDDVDRLPRTAQGAVAEVLEGRAEAGRATVLASALSPGEIPHADARLSRVSASGLVVELDLPGPDRRLALLRSLPADPALDPAVLEALALLPVRNIRELLGAFRRLVAFQAVSRHPLDVSQAAVLLGELGAAAPGPEGTPGNVPGAHVVTAPGDRVRAFPDEAEVDLPRADEFGDFLSEVVATVAEQVDRWRERVGAAILRWEGEEIRTARLERLLREEFPEDPDTLLAEFERDAGAIVALAREARALDSRAGEGPEFQDPDDLPAARRALDQIRLRVAGLPGPDPTWRLDTFVESTSTRSVLRALDRLLGGDTGDNPVVVQGPGGSGKTHLLHGFGSAWMERHGGVVACLSSSDFAAGEPAAWWSGLRTASALLVDDLDRVGTHRTRALLVDALEALVSARRPVLVTTSTPLQELEGLESRLVSRLTAGVIVELEAPDRELRARLVMHALPEGPRDDAALVDAIARPPAASARAVQAAVQRVMAAATRRGTAPTSSLAREALEEAPSPAALRVRSGSGLQNPLLSGARLQEKIIPVWPQVTDQLLEEFR